jgi:hypothetical protein
MKSPPSSVARLALSLLLFVGLAAVAARAETFALTIYETPAAIAARTDPKAGPAYWEAFAAFGKTLQDAGVLRGGSAFFTGERVQTVTIKAGQRTVKPGAHAPSHDELGGYFVIEVANLAEALAWAARAPNATTGAVEVRPYYPAPVMK